MTLDEFIKLTDNNFYKLFSKAKRDNNFNEIRILGCGGSFGSPLAWDKNWKY